MTKQNLKKLRKSLPAGWKETLAKEFNYHPEHINRVLLGRAPNRIILDKAIEMAVVEKERRIKMDDKIKSL